VREKEYSDEDSDSDQELRCFKCAFIWRRDLPLDITLTWDTTVSEGGDSRRLWTLSLSSNLLGLLHDFPHTELPGFTEAAYVDSVPMKGMFTTLSSPMGFNLVTRSSWAVTSRVHENCHPR